MGKPTGFKEFTRELPSKLTVTERKQNYKEFVSLFPEKKIKRAVCKMHELRGSLLS